MVSWTAPDELAGAVHVSEAAGVQCDKKRHGLYDQVKNHCPAQRQEVMWEK